MSKIKHDEHVFICGATGSGKSFLAEVYTKNLKKVFVLDVKGLFSWSNMNEEEQAKTIIITSVTHLKKFDNENYTHIIYRPEFNEMETEFYNEFFEYCYYRKNCCVLVDECMAITTSNNIPVFYKAILTRGRALNVQVYSCSQRPSTISPLCITESTHIFCFRLNSYNDRKKLELFTSQKTFLDNLTGHEFFYYNTANGMVKPIRSILKPKTK